MQFCTATCGLKQQYRLSFYQMVESGGLFRYKARSKRRSYSNHAQVFESRREKSLAITRMFRDPASSDVDIFVCANPRKHFDPRIVTRNHTRIDKLDRHIHIQPPSITVSLLRLLLIPSSIPILVSLPLLCHPCALPRALNLRLFLLLNRWLSNNPTLVCKFHRSFLLIFRRSFLLIVRLLLGLLALLRARVGLGLSGRLLLFLYLLLVCLLLFVLLC
jgi:hypothetical protein